MNKFSRPIVLYFENLVNYISSSFQASFLVYQIISHICFDVAGLFLWSKNAFSARYWDGGCAPAVSQSFEAAAARSFITEGP